MFALLERVFGAWMGVSSFISTGLTCPFSVCKLLCFHWCNHDSCSLKKFLSLILKWEREVIWNGMGPTSITWSGSPGGWAFRQHWIAFKLFAGQLCPTKSQMPPALWGEHACPWPGSVCAANAHFPQGRFAVAKALLVVEVSAGRNFLKKRKKKEKKKGRKQAIFFWGLWMEESVSQSLRHEPPGQADGRGQHQTWACLQEIICGFLLNVLAALNGYI